MRKKGQDGKQRHRGAKSDAVRKAEGEGNGTLMVLRGDGVYCQ